MELEGVSDETGKARPSRILIATNHLQRISGSEVVTLEAARHFTARGCTVTIVTNWAGPPMAELIEAIPGISLSTEPAAVRPFTHDMVYAQHQLLGLFDYTPHADDREETNIVIGRLSRRSYFESGGWLHDRILADHVLANSALTAEHLVGIGHDGPITNFFNAAPAAFFRPFAAKPAAPRRALVVSNHADSALIEAIAILRQSIDVRHIGRKGGDVALVTPEIIAGADVVISIGKTIPYALAGHVPVYVYDHFGGPGYLDAANCEAAARFNFTGRCCARQLSGAGIAAEVMGDYAKGVAFARDVPAGWLDRYHLPRYLDLLLQPARSSNDAKRRRMAASPFLAQERLLADYIRQSYIREQRLARKVDDLGNRLKRRAAETRPR